MSLRGSGHGDGGDGDDSAGLLTSGVQIDAVEARVGGWAAGGVSGRSPARRVWRVAADSRARECRRKLARCPRNAAATPSSSCARVGAASETAASASKSARS
jgi:hypothetical protein